MYPYYYYYDIMSAMPIAILVAIILGIVLYFTFLKKENEDKYTGWKKVVYDFFNFNKFYAEDIMKLVYVMLTAAFVVIGVFMLFVNIGTALILLVLGNVALRVSYELIMMFVILCRKTVSIDKKLDKVVAFYGDDFDEGDCDGDCGACDSECEDREEDEEAFEFFCGGNCSGCNVEGCGGIVEEEKDEETELGEDDEEAEK